MNYIALGVEYQGTNFHGFQRDGDRRTVQHSLEFAISAIANEPVQIVVAGRTDAGVHATQQVVNFASRSSRPSRAWTEGVNSKLPDDVAVIWSESVTEGFNARRAALWRRYIYVFGHVSARQVFSQKLVCWIEDQLNVSAMREAAILFIGERDFSAVRAAACSSQTPYRYVYSLSVRKVGSYVVIDTVANAFLMHMMRNIASILCDVGLGRLQATDCKALLDAGDRRLAPPTSPAAGLYLIQVGYPDGSPLNLGPRVPAILGETACSFPSVELPDDYFRKPSIT